MAAKYFALLHQSAMIRLTTVEKSDGRMVFFAFYGNIPWQRMLLPPSKSGLGSWTCVDLSGYFPVVSRRYDVCLARKAARRVN